MRTSLLVLWILLVASTGLVHAGEVYTFQGRITDSEGYPLDGSVRLTFRVYPAETGGSAIWTETHYPVEVRDGVYTVLLGSVTSLSLGSGDYWISVEIDSDGEMSPRLRVTRGNLVGPSGAGVFGFSSADVGVHGLAYEKAGVYGYSYSEYGVYGLSASDAGVFGESTDNEGVYGSSVDGIDVHGESTDSAGVLGESESDIGVYGRSPRSYGVYGSSKSSYGLYGYSSASYGIYASSRSHRGVYVDSYRGLYSKTSSGYDAIHGYATGGGTMALIGVSSTGYGIWAQTNTSSSYSAYFYGGKGVYVNGGLYISGSKSFVEPYPGDSGRAITYVCPEGGEAGTYFRGSARLVNGRARIELPDHFRLVTSKDGITAQATPNEECNGLFVPSFSNSHIEVRELEGGTSNAKFHYAVWGVRRGYESFEPVTSDPAILKALSAEPREEPVEEDR